ncbi:MAG: hypothetical protein IPG26_06345 [Coprothermobacter sp.]|nr:hypothetical protein [Coprothermobacter sp.]
MEDERMIALSDAGIPYRDHGLDDSPEKIIERRKNERMVLRNVKKISSTVRTPIYLGRRVEMDRMGRRILKNLERVGIPDTRYPIRPSILYAHNLRSVYVVVDCLAYLLRGIGYLRWKRGSTQ